MQASLPLDIGIGAGVKSYPPPSFTMVERADGETTGLAAA